MNNKFYCIIMGGGVGSRFWPVSREHKPKQFLDFFGTGESLLQQTFRRMSQIVPTENILIVTNEIYIEETLRQLPMIRPEQILAEPIRRNTAPCIAYAAYHIYEKCPDASIFVTPSDHIILQEARFAEFATKALTYVARHDSLVTLGIRAMQPETGYGYIQMDPEKSDDLEEGFLRVKVFTEKPDREMAEVFVRSGDFLWNSGMFAWNAKTILAALEAYAGEVTEVLGAKPEVYGTPEEAAFIQKAFPCCPSISIDYAVMEKAQNVLVLPSDFGWADLGTWGAVYEQASKDDAGNAALNTRCFFQEAENNVVSLSDPSRIVVMHGVSDCIVAEHDNVLLICRRDAEQRVKGMMANAEVLFGKEYV